MLRRAFSLSRLGATAGMLLIASLLVAPDATAASLNAPSNLDPNGLVGSTTPTFSWSRVSGATGYEFQLDDSSDFGSTIHTATTTNNTYVPTIRLKAGTAYWRVRATGPSGVHSTWAGTEILVDETAPPTPVSPIDGAPLPQPESPALLRWSPVTGAAGYQVEVDADGNWVGAASYTAAGTSFQVPTPQAPEVWHWRVRADLGNGTFTQWSGPLDGATYEILPLEDVQPDPSMEVGGAVQDVVLKWLPVPGATKYEVEVGLNDDFTQPVETRTVVSTRYSPTITYDNDQFFWRVRAIDAGGNKMPWPAAPLSFQRSWPQKPELVWPPNQVAPAVGDDFYFQWTPVRHATRYQLEMGPDPNFSPNTVVKCTTAGTTFTAASGDYLGCMPAQGQRTYWRVRAVDGPRSPLVEGIYSDIHEFVYDSGRVQQLSPADGASVAVPTLRWAPATDAVSYKVELRNSGDNLVGSTTTNSLSWTPTGSTVLDPTQGPFSWTVQSVDYSGSTSPKYTGRTFSIAGSPEDTPAAPLTPVATPAGTRFPALGWEPLPGAAYYKVQIGVAGSNYWDQPGSSPISTTNFPYPSATDTGEKYLVPGTYMWQVQAYTVTGGVTTASGWGPTGTFVIEDLPAVEGQRIALDGQALDADTTCDDSLGQTPAEDLICLGVPATPVLDWDAVPEAGLYMVYLGNDRELTNRLYTGMKTSSSRWTPTSTMSFEALADNQSGESYYWYIRPCKTPSVCGPDPVSTDRAATNAFRKTSPRVELLDPAANSVNECTTEGGGLKCADDIAFSWRDYHATNQDVQFAGGTAPSHQTAMKYRIEISDSASFTKTLHYQEVDQPTYTLFSETLPEGDLWWRVQAIDADGNKLAWSDPAKVTKASGGVDLTAPVDGVAVPGDTPFSWEPQQHASGYRIEVYRNDDSTYSSSNLAFAADTKLASYVAAKYLPASPTPYRWRVRWVDASIKQGPWSDGGTFRVVPGVVQLTRPASNGYVPHNGPVLSWTPVGTAAKYLVTARLVGSTSPIVNVTTAATSYATTTNLASGVYEWRVLAYDTSNPDPAKALAASPWRQFRVDSIRPTVTRMAPTTTAKTTANFVATFSEPVTGLSSSTMKLYVAGRTTPLPARVTINSTARVATLNPTKNLVKGKTYTVKLVSGIKDRAGNALAPTNWKVTAK
jgi:hypothetical protein